LLIAICLTYQSSTTPQFSAWGGGFTEFADSGSTNGGFGAAYKWSDGTETGTFTVTQAATVTGHATMILMTIVGAHPSTVPEISDVPSGSGAAIADPSSLNPAGWGTEDTLWIAVDANGMTSGTGSWTGTGAGTLTNYSGQARSSTVDNSTVGQIEGVVSFRQVNAASEDRGAVSTHDTSNARNFATLIAVRPALVNPQPGALALVTTYGTPAVTVNWNSQPTALALTTSYGTPTVTATNNVLASPASVALVLTMSTPAVAAPRVALPAAVGLTLTMATPSVVVNNICLPTALALTTTYGTPAVLAPRVSLPPALALTTTYGTPAIATPVLVSPSALALVTAFSTPTVTAGSGSAVTVLPDALALALTLDTPAVEVAAVPAPEGPPAGMQQQGSTETPSVTDRRRAKAGSRARNAEAAARITHNRAARQRLSGMLRALHSVA
jgi:hypothetical protein